MVNARQQWAMMFLVVALLLFISAQLSAADAAVLVRDHSEAIRLTEFIQ